MIASYVRGLVLLAAAETRDTLFLQACDSADVLWLPVR